MKKMKKFLVIGNPIEHSLSPKLHNYWIKKNNLDAIYGKLETYESDLSELCKSIKKGDLDGLNITVPFKKSIIPHLDILSSNALKTQSVNTISLSNGNLIGDNTDIDGFELSIRKLNYDVSDKTALILGAGGVVPSIIFSLLRMNVSKIFLSNRTKKKADDLKEVFKEINVVEWGELPEFDMIINATTLGLNKEDKFGFEFLQTGQNKLFYDVIYAPFQTEFSEAGNTQGNLIENGLNMFLFQGQQAFNIWHNVEPEIDNELVTFLKY
ncbi:shikimate dehydrogenase [Pelagibacteraceae bacterium GOM-A3]|nr:shikimate dehydrogenase [Pelagibacteraceae bacterium GOM-A3]